MENRISKTGATILLVLLLGLIFAFATRHARAEYPVPTDAVGIAKAESGLAKSKLELRERELDQLLRSQGGEPHGSVGGTYEPCREVPCSHDRTGY